MTAGERDHYQRLGLARDAAAGGVAKAYRRAARLTHPDAGGSDEDFAAVAEAYRVLGDPTLRAEYDRELDGAGAGWDDVGWGADVGPTVPEEPADGGQADVDGLDLPPEGVGPDEAPGSTQAAPTGDGILHPFVGPPRRIPDPLASPRQAVPGVRPGAREWAASIACWILLVVTFVVQARARAHVATGGGDTADLDEKMIMPIVIGGVAVLVHSAVARRSDGEVWAWVFTAFAAASTGSYLNTVFERPVGVLIGLAASTVATLAAGVTWALLFRRRRADPERQRTLREAHPAWLLERYHRAVEWNRVRTALQEPGTTAVILGDLIVGQPGYAGMTSRWTFDPRSGHEVVRVVPDDAPQGSWLVLDDEGDVIAAAPAGAPEAWVSALTPA